MKKFWKDAGDVVLIILFLAVVLWVGLVIGGTLLKLTKWAVS